MFGILHAHELRLPFERDERSTALRPRPLIHITQCGMEALYD